MGKSFKSVITVFRDYDNMRTVYTSLPKPKRENTFKDEVMAAKNICVKPAFPLHSLHVLLAMALFVPQFGLVLFSGCSCSSHQGKICYVWDCGCTGMLKLQDEGTEVCQVHQTLSGRLPTGCASSLCSLLRKLKRKRWLGSSG